ncbi:MAG: WD40 repeat domain-containing protein [Sedimentisphaerales bacterium]
MRLWDAASGKPLGALEGHTSWIADMVFSKDGRLLYSCSGDQTIRIWDVGQQQCLATLRGSSHEVIGLALSPDSTTLVSACKDGVVAFWSAVPQPEEEIPRRIPLGHWARPAFAPDSGVLAVPRAGCVSLLDLDTPKKEIEQIAELGADVEVVTFSPDGALLVSGGKAGEIRVWSRAGRCLLHLPELDGHKERITFLRFQADGTRLLSLDVAGMAIWWDALTWQADRASVVKLPVTSNEYWWPIDLSPDGHLLAFGTGSGNVCWLDAETGELLETKSGGQRTMQVTFSGDGSRLASASVYGTVALWDPSSFTLVTLFRAHLLGAQGVVFSPDGKRLVTGGGTSQDAVRLWDLSTYRELITLPGKSTVFRFVVFSPDGRWLAACSESEGDLYLWCAPSWEEIEAEEKRLESR